MSKEEAPAAEAAPSAEMVPRARLSEVIAERNDMRTQLEALRAEMAPMQERIDSLSAYQTKAAELEAQLGSVRALSQAGIVDEEGQAVAGLLYERVAEKPEGGLRAWLQGLADSPDSAPTPLRPYLARPAAPAPAAPAPAATAPTPTATPDTTAVAPSSGVLSTEALADARQRLARGDRSALADIKRHFSRRMG